MRDAANPWIFSDSGVAWGGVQFVAFSGSPESGHGVDVTATFAAGVASLACHELYLENLSGEMASPDEFLRGPAVDAGRELGCELAATFELVF